MISIFDFRKSSGEKIPDIVEYVKNYVKTHSNIDVIVGTDSQVDHSKTVFSTVVAMYDRGDGEHGHGAHCISKRWFLPKYRKEQRIDRLLKETEESINIAKALRENGVKIKYIDIDISPNPKHKSSEAYPAAYGWVTGEGFECRDKSQGPCVTRYADWQVKK
jgi:predicted RNase H-related nuclease YkuK (DUF458 family)